MPEPPSGTDTTTTTPPAGGDTPPPGGDDKPFNPAQEKRLSEENARRRLENKALKTEIDDLKAVLATLQGKGGDEGEGDDGEGKPRKPAAGSPADSEDKRELAKLKRELDQLREQSKQREAREKELESKSRQKTIDTALADIAAKAQIEDSDGAKIILRQFATVDDDDVVVFNVKDEVTGEAIKVPATVDSVKKHKLLHDHFYPAQGAGGSGSRPGARGAAPAGTLPDSDALLANPELYRKNRDKIMEQRKATR